MAVTTHVDSTAAATQFSDGHTLILYQANDGTIHQLAGDGPVVSPRTAYVDEEVSAAGDVVRDGTPLAVTGVTQTHLYYTNKSERLCQLVRSRENPTWEPEIGFDTKLYTTQQNSTLLYAISDAASPTVGFKAAKTSNSGDTITEVRGSMDPTTVQGGQNFVTLVNGTPYRWDLSAPTSLGMTSWSFPPFIAAGKSFSVYLDRDASIATCSGEVTYTLDGTGKDFQVKAKESGHTFTLEVFLRNLSTQNNEEGTTIDLGWNRRTRPVNFILSGEVGNFSSTNMPTNWMQINLSRLGNRTLRHLCIPGSHDAGMCKATDLTPGVVESDVITQRKPIGGDDGQLALGTRYFDIRPVLNTKTSVYYTGHYGSRKEYPGIYLGANGQRIEEVVDHINQFTSINEELIILRLSHDIAYKDQRHTGFREGSEFTQAQWNGLFAKLKLINHRFTIENPTSVDLTKLELNQFIKGKPAVVIIVKFPPVEPPTPELKLDTYADDGFYLYSQLDSYNKFVNNPDTNEMARDQIEKMHNIRTSPDDQHFVLSWTLTKKLTKNSLGGGTILNLADEANPELYKRLVPSSSLQSYPNVLYTDAIDNSDPAALSMVINNVFGRKHRFSPAPMAALTPGKYTIYASIDKKYYAGLDDVNEDPQPVTGATSKLRPKQVWTVAATNTEGFYTLTIQRSECNSLIAGESFESTGIPPKSKAIVAAYTNQSSAKEWKITLLGEGSDFYTIEADEHRWTLEGGSTEESNRILIENTYYSARGIDVSVPRKPDPTSLWKFEPAN